MDLGTTKNNNITYTDNLKNEENINQALKQSISSNIPSPNTVNNIK